MEKSKNSINVEGGFLFWGGRIFSKSVSVGPTFIREMRVCFFLTLPKLVAVSFYLHHSVRNNHSFVAILRSLSFCLKSHLKSIPTFLCLSCNKNKSLWAALLMKRKVIYKYDYRTKPENSSTHVTLFISSVSNYNWTICFLFFAWTTIVYSVSRFKFQFCQLFYILCMLSCT